MDERKAKEELGKGKLFGALVVPGDFTASTTALTGTATTKAPVRPTLTVLTNQSAGSVGSSLARTATTQAAETASLQVGKELTAQSGTGEAKLPAAARLLLADPAAVTVEDGHPLHSRSGLGMTAFYYALALVVVGMLSAASHLPLLWLYSVCAIAVTGIGALTLLAVFGTPGMLVVTLVFIGMAVPTAGATTPSTRCPASTASSRSSSRCGRSPAVSARSSPTTPRPMRASDPGLGVATLQQHPRRGHCSE